MDLISVMYNVGKIPNCIQGFLFYRILCHFAQKRDGKLWSAAGYISCACLSNMIIYPNDFFNVVLELVWFLALMLLAFQGSIWQRLAAVAVLYPLIVSQNFFVMDMLGVLGSSLDWPIAIDLFCTIADPILHLLIWYGIYRFFERHLVQARKLFGHKTCILLDVICLASLVSITTSILFAPVQSYYMWPAAFSCFATNLGCIALTE